SSRDLYTISWINDKDKKQGYFVTTKDFKSYSPAKKAALFERKTEVIKLAGDEQSGTLHKVAWGTVDKVIKAQQLAAYKTKLNSERSDNHQLRISSLKDIKATINIEKDTTREISDLLSGIFLKDIKCEADGCPYAELIKNRGFEYSPAFRKEWNSLTA